MSSIYLLTVFTTLSSRIQKQYRDTFPWIPRSGKYPTYFYANEFPGVLRLRWSGTRFPMLSALARLKNDTQSEKSGKPPNRKIDEYRTFLLPYVFFLLRFLSAGVANLSSLADASMCTDRLRKKNFSSYNSATELYRAVLRFHIIYSVNTCEPCAIHVFIN